MIKLGTKVTFDPFNGVNISGFSKIVHRNVIGKVIDIYEDHKWFGVEYKLGDTIQRASFKFTDIGKSVKLCGSHAEERCVCCGDIIPEGRQVCINCENSAKGE